jgi:hypothetical protein
MEEFSETVYNSRTDSNRVSPLQTGGRWNLRKEKEQK